jgi:lysophospholipase L1-like esterase
MSNENRNPEPPRGSTRGAFVAAIVVTLSVVVPLLLAEAGLRLAGFHPGRVNTGYLQFGYSTGIPTFDEDGVLKEGPPPARVRLFGPDPFLLWTPLPDTPYTNSQGFRGSGEYTEEKPGGVVRVLYLGDSCTFFGDPVYPEIVRGSLAARLPGRRIECINASVPGYTSVQGERRWERLSNWKPDVVVVYFGWNDHWPARGGLTDRDQFAIASGPRLLGMVRALRGRWRSGRLVRVPLDDFEATLTAMRVKIERAGAVPYFITAPTGFRAGAMPPWAYGFYSQFYGMSREAVDAIPSLHGAYADAVRRVASGGHAVLVDAERELAGNDPTLLYRNDQIHLRTPGHEAIASLLAATIMRNLRV